jgi:hypothetical protein
VSQDTYTISIRNIGDFVSFCQAHEVRTVFRHRDGFRNRWQDDFHSHETAVLSYKGVCVFQGIRTVFRLPITDQVPPNWSLDAQTKTLKREFSKKSDARKCLADLGANADQLKGLFQISVKDMKTITDESNEEESGSSIVVKESREIPSFTFKVQSMGIRSARLEIIDNGYRSKLDYAVVAEWADAFDEITQVIEKELKAKIPEIRIIDGEITT